MDKKETITILAYLKIAFPIAFSKMTNEDLEAMVNLWTLQFADYDCKVVKMAVDSYISTDTTGYYPTIGKLKEMVHKLSHRNEMSEQEAWNRVKQALKRSGWYAQEEFEALPPTLQRLVGSPNQLHDWSQTDSDELNTVIASNFMRSYRNRVTQEKEYDLLPNSIKENIEQLAGSFIKQIGG